MRYRSIAVLLFASLFAVSVWAINEDPGTPAPTPTLSPAQATPAPIEVGFTANVINDEGGPVLIRGVLPITNINVKRATMRPVIILEDQVNFVARNFEGKIAKESQVLAFFTSDFFAAAPVEYELNLPAMPRGTFLDVDQNGQPDPGVQIFQIGYWDDRFGQIYLNDKEIYAWSTAYSSARADEDPRRMGELIGGKLIVFAAEPGQGFPSGFGEDGLLFTADDPIVTLPVGYSVVNLDTTPFTFDRAREQVINLIEPDSLVLDDFSMMNYLEAFDALIDKARIGYSFTEYKGIDWDAIAAQMRPLFEEAERSRDRLAYFRALDELVMLIPDGHVAAYGSPLVVQARRQPVAGSVGMNLRELTDGRILVNFVLENGPAQRAGIRVGAEVIAINNVPIQDYLRTVRPATGPFSNYEMLRLAQVAYAARFPLNTTAIVTYRNPGMPEQTARMSVIEDNFSLAYGQALQNGTLNSSQFAAPVEFSFTRSGVGVVKVNTFDGNEALIVSSWHFFLETANQIGSPGIVIDLRSNSGGFSFIANRLAATLYDGEVELYTTESFNRAIGEFYVSPLGVERLKKDEDAPTYRGRVAVLVGPGCASACEFFAYALTREGRSTVIGQHGTYAIGGGWSPTFMPDGIRFALPTNRKFDAAGNIVVEGVGIQPDIRVPVTESNFASSDDVVLQRALDFIATGR
ncbi:S41 family peptidase [Aggregatilineales bacterium SYSU G02658]